MEWALENENHPTKVQSDVIDLSHSQQNLDGTVRISFDDSRFRSPLIRDGSRILSWRGLEYKEKTNFK